MFSTKTTIVIVAAALTTVLATSIFHLENGIHYFISMSAVYNAVREGALLVLVSLLFIKPPRSILMRLFLGATGIMLHIGSVYLLLGYAMNLVDAFVFMAVAVVFMVEALEPQTITGDERVPA